MSFRVGLAIGDSFAEAQGHTLNSKASPIRSRWFLPKKSLKDGLKELVQSLTEQSGETDAVGTAYITMTTVERALARRQGQPPAVLVTTGLESWLKTRSPLASPAFTLRPSPIQTVAESDFIFGVSGRILADGSVASPMSIEDLEFLAAKLQMLKVSNVAIAFMNSGSNPEHEKQAASYLTERGFKTVMSHACASPNQTEGERWMAAIESAYAEAAVEELRSEAEAALPGWDLKVWGRSGLLDWKDASAALIAGGREASLVARVKAGANPSIHFGLERFESISNKGAIEPLRFGPTRLIAQGAWPFPDLSRESCGYEPGPMLFGKSHQLSVIDVLSLQNRLSEIEGLSPQISERARPRILEALLTFGKTIPSPVGRRSADAQEIAEDLESLFMEELSVLIAEMSGQTVEITGGLAPAFSALLKKRFPDKKLSIGEALDWRESEACLAFEGVK